MNYINIKYFPSNKHFYLTKKGLDEMKDRLDALRNERYSVCQHLRKMDPRERADYIFANDIIKKLDMNEAEVDRISEALQHSSVVTKEINSSSVKLGSIVNLRFEDRLVKYRLVETLEADPSHNKISEKSPLGRTLIGRKAHESVKFVTPIGKVFNCVVDSIA